MPALFPNVFCGEWIAGGAGQPAPTAAREAPPRTPEPSEKLGLDTVSLAELFHGLDPGFDLAGVVRVRADGEAHVVVQEDLDEAGGGVELAVGVERAAGVELGTVREERKASATAW